MAIDFLRRRIKSEVFDYQLLISLLGNLKKPRDKISALLAENKIVRVKKGLYVFGQEWRQKPLCLETIANLIYGPSCISFETALNHYGMIAERAQVITSLAIGDSKMFYTPLGTFEYRAIAKEKFKVGIEYIDLGDEGGYFIASREKAVVDLIYRTAGIRTLEQLRFFLFEEMRLDESMFRKLDFSKLQELCNAYQKTSVKMLVKL
jgi:predicted transcriptional regulator of viral defense system